MMLYAPIIPRLKRLFRNEVHAKWMRWHNEDRKKDGKLRAPADGSRWRKIETKYWEDFAGDARNVWFGLSAYGINPFGEQSSNHSTWPVTLCIYNLLLGNVAEIQNFPTCHQDLSMEKPATRGRRVHLHTLLDR